MKLTKAEKKMLNMAAFSLMESISKAKKNDEKEFFKGEIKAYCEMIAMITSNKWEGIMKLAAEIAKRESNYMTAQRILVNKLV